MRNATNMIDPTLVDAAIAHAVSRAARESGGFSVYTDATKAYVRPSAEPSPAGATLLCIAQIWDASTVQVRYAGARSEFVRI